MIGVVSSVGGILILVAAWFLWRRQRKLLRDARAWREVAGTGQSSNKSHVHTTSTVVEVAPVEVAAREVAAVEVSAQLGPVEIGSSEYRYSRGARET